MLLEVYVSEDEVISMQELCIENEVSETEILEKYMDITEVNNDVYGYMYLPNGLEYPIMFTPYDQNKYINLDINQVEVQEGTPFLNRLSVLGEPGISLIYGHNMKNGKAFSCLRNYYENANYFSEYNLMQINTIWEEATYEIVAVALTSLYEDFNYYEYVGNITKGEFESWKTGFEPYVVVGSLSDLEYKDTIVELSTCYYHKEDGRLIIILRKV